MHNLMKGSATMGKHSVPHGEKSTLGQANGSPQSENYKPKHSATTEMDIPPRGQGITIDDHRQK